MNGKLGLWLWFDGTAEEAARFYAATFPDSAVTRITRAVNNYPGGKEGDVLVVEFMLLGTPCFGLNGGPMFPQTEAFSFQILTDTQEETDRYWDAITANGGHESMCGWCKDRWGVNWQITPRIMMDVMQTADPDTVRRANTAMYGMKKFDHAAIAAAIAGPK